MKLYKAIRLSLSEAEILDSNDRSIARISWPKVAIWKTQNAPLSDALGNQCQSNPTIETDQKKWTAYRKLLTNNFLANDYEISLGDGNGEARVLAELKGTKRKIVIRFEGEEYHLIREGFFSFHFKLQKGPTIFFQMRDVTPFFTFSSRREFEVSSERLLDPTLLSFSFFLAHNSFF
nr:hypothetical protein BHI3_09210 [Bacteriovorax sp. HI3]